MRRMLLLRGAPGSGKTTFASAHGHTELTVSFDAFRELVYPRAVALDGKRSLLGGAEKTIAAMAHKAAEHRMVCGATVIVDATNLTARTQGEWAILAQKYGYTIGLIDCQVGISDDELRRRNETRGVRKLDPESLETMLTRARDNARHPDVVEVTETSLNDFFALPDASLGSPARVAVVGDVHSCPAALKQALSDLDDETVVVFAGDLFDGGPDAADVYRQITNLDPDRVVLVEGNHDTLMRRLASGAIACPPAETAVSHNQILGLAHTDADILALLDRAVPLARFTCGGQDYLVTHGGITQTAYTRLNLPSATDATIDGRHIVDRELILGTSDRSDIYRGKSTYRPVDNELSINGIIQLHGHRNTHPNRQAGPTGDDSVVNLEADVENGGRLRMALITPTGLEVREYSNNPDQPHTSAFLAALAAHPHIRAKPCGGGVTAYNFTRTAFKRGLWDEKTVTARGLFVRDGQVVGRGFDKFFNLGEHGESLDDLAYPVTAAEKVNGFLGIAFVLDGKIVVWSKSGPTDYAAAAQDAFERQIAGNQRERLADLMADENVSLALEIVIDSDPHLVPVTGVAEVTLLSVIANDEHFRTRPDLLDKICLPQAETLGALGTARARSSRTRRGTWSKSKPTGTCTAAKPEQLSHACGRARRRACRDNSPMSNPSSKRPVDGAVWMNSRSRRRQGRPHSTFRGSSTGSTDADTKPRDRHSASAPRLDACFYLIAARRRAATTRPSTRMRSSGKTRSFLSGNCSATNRETINNVSSSGSGSLGQTPASTDPRTSGTAIPSMATAVRGPSLIFTRGTRPLDGMTTSAPSTSNTTG